MALIPFPCAGAPLQFVECGFYSVRVQMWADTADGWLYITDKVRGVRPWGAGQLRGRVGIKARARGSTGHSASQPAHIEPLHQSIAVGQKGVDAGPAVALRSTRECIRCGCCGAILGGVGCRELVGTRLPGLSARESVATSKRCKQCLRVRCTTPCVRCLVGRQSRHEGFLAQPATSDTGCLVPACCSPQGHDLMGRAATGTAQYSGARGHGLWRKGGQGTDLT